MHIKNKVNADFASSYDVARDKILSLDVAEKHPSHHAFIKKMETLKISSIQEIFPK